MPAPVSMGHGVLRAPDALHFGEGARVSIAPAVEKFGRRLGVIVDAFFLDSPEFLEVLKSLDDRGIEYRTFSDVVPELPLDSVEIAAARFSGLEPDALLAYGGGSAIDLAKLVALRLVTSEPLAEFYGENRVGRTVLPLIAVPTTAGTGSEVTSVAVVSDPSHALKVGISDPVLIPRVAIVDPELTLGAPPSITAYSGIDALAHAIESHTARDMRLDWSKTLPVATGANRLNSGFALGAIGALGASLVDAYRDGGDRAARRNNAYGATLAGIAFSNAGVHLGHAVQYPLGALTKTPHGMGTGLLLPYVMRACMPWRVERLAEVGTALVPAMTGTAEERAEAAISRVAGITRAIGLPRSLREMGVAKSQLDEIVEKSLGIARLIGNAPFEANTEIVGEIVRNAYVGGAP